MTEDQTRDGPITGTVSGSTLTFNARFGMNCPRTINGTTTVAGDTMSGTFNRQDCNNRPISNGTLSLSIRRLNLGGTWSGNVDPTVFGFASWTWQVTQNGANITANVSAQGSTGTLNGTLVQTGPNPENARLTFTVTLTGQCAATLEGTTALPGGLLVERQIGARANGSSCRGTVTNGVVVMFRQ